MNNICAENVVSSSRLEKIITAVGGMTTLNHIEILKICTQSNVTTNENINGNFINLSIIPVEVIDKIEKYITYVADLEKLIQTMEVQKENYKTIFASGSQVSSLHIAQI